MNKKIVCPHCGDTWEYKMVVDHTTNKVIITNEWCQLEDGADCVCYKCHNHYNIKITTPADVAMDDFIYNLWTNCKM